VLLTNELQVLGVKTVNTGSLKQVLVDVSQIIKIALLSNASQIVLAHNHPSGRCEPSRADLELTSKVKKAADLFDITVADHIILTANSHFSFDTHSVL
jgi:DNA repair protein RadC